MLTELNNRYLEVNASFGSPFVYSLTRRGFYSEINNLLNAVIFGLAHKRQLIVDQSQFDDLDWQCLFATELPFVSAALTERVPAEWIISGIHSPNFRKIRQWAKWRHNIRIPLWFPQMRIWGSMFDVKREIAQALTRPLVAATVPAGLTEPFAAIHIRRGDKTDGYMDGKQQLIIQGDDVDPRTYIDMLMLKSPEIKSIFVMTDNYSMIEDLKQAGPDYSISTLCHPEEMGYYQPAFSSLEPVQKADRIQRLIAETQIAAASSIFLGGYKSNVARFVRLSHAHPDRCLSVDSQKRWLPD